MKAFQFLRAVIILSGLLLSACAGAPASQAVDAVISAGADKPLSEVVFTGAIDGMNGDQWIINGQTVKVDASLLRDAPFAVGDTVKVEAHVADDGSVTAQRVESTTASVTSTPDAAPTQPSQSVANNATEALGTVDALTNTSITLGGQTYVLAPGVEIKGTLEVGTLAKLHFVTNTDGTVLVQEISSADPAQATGNSSSGSNDSSNGTGVGGDHSQSTSDSSSSGNSLSDDHPSSTSEDSSNGDQVSDDPSSHESGDDNQGGSSTDNGLEDSGNHG